MRNIMLLLLSAIALVAALASSSFALEVLVLDQSLQESTNGTRLGGSFVDGGWKITGQYDSIYWHLPRTISHGIAEFSVVGLRPMESRPTMTDKSELVHMYDYTFDNADTNYMGYRNNPYKSFLRKAGTNPYVYGEPDSLDQLWQILPNHNEPSTDPLVWDPNVTYVFRMEWGPDGLGGSYFKSYRNGVHMLTVTQPALWNPVGHTFRIAASNRRAEDAGAPIDAVFSNVKVWEVVPEPSSFAAMGMALSALGFWKLRKP